MVAIREQRILNFTEMKKELTTNSVYSNVRNVQLTTSADNEKKTLSLHDFYHLKNEIMSMAKKFPHRKIVLMYKLSDQQSVSIEILPMGDSA